MSKHVFYLYWCNRQKSISTKIEEEIKKAKMFLKYNTTGMGQYYWCVTNVYMRNATVVA